MAKTNIYIETFGVYEELKSKQIILEMSFATLVFVQFSISEQVDALAHDVLTLSTRQK